jgi:hypothetical protein
MENSGTVYLTKFQQAALSSPVGKEQSGRMMASLVLEGNSSPLSRSVCSN